MTPEELKILLDNEAEIEKRMEQNLPPTSEQIKLSFRYQQAKFRGEIPVNGLSVELSMAFAQIASQLSPENLYEDGEISESMARKKYTILMREWKQLEIKAGRKVESHEFPY